MSESAKSKKKIIGYYSGEELTEEFFEEVEAEAEAGCDLVDGKVVYLGRPTLSPSGSGKPINVRVEPELDDQLRAFALAEGRTISDVTREAVREYLQRHDAA